MTWLLFPFVGLMTSILSGFFGIGGGFILTPFLLLIGFSPIEAITTSLLFSVGTSLVGGISHIRNDNINWKMVCQLGISGIVATQFAQPLVMFLSVHKLDEVIIPFAYIVLLLYFAWKMLKESKNTKATKAERFLPNKRNTVLLTILIGFSGGFVSTSLGVGGGFIMVPLLITLLGLEAKRAVGTSLMSILFIVSSGFITYMLRTPVDISIGILLVAGALFGAPLGVRLTRFYLHRETTRWLSILYLTTMISIIFKLLQFSVGGLLTIGTFMVLFSLYSTKKIINHFKVNSSHV